MFAPTPFNVSDPLKRSELHVIYKSNKATEENPRLALLTHYLASSCEKMTRGLFFVGVLHFGRPE